VDAFVPLGRGYVPHSIHRVEEEKDDELFILPYELRNETVEYGGITMKVNGNRVEIKGETYSFSRIKTQNGLILIVLGNEALVYDPGKNTVTRYLEVLDGDFVGDRGETDSTMWLQKGTTWKNYRMCLFRKKKSENGQKENVVP
jgi:hypothetical protein